MKSRVVVAGHPLHPILIPFPIAFLVGAVLADLYAWLRADATVWTLGTYLIPAGIATGLLAAVPGIVDYLTVVPPESSGKRRATKHMASNVSALVLFGLAWLLRPELPAEATVLLLLLEVGALGLLGAGGYMGGTLVYRNQIGVDHRYAHAGKWQEETIGADGEARVMVGHPDDLEPGQMKLLHVDGRRIVLCRTERGYAAIDDRCTHRGASLADGVLICGVVQCPWHGSQFDVDTGEAKAGPAKRGIKTYTVKRQNGELRLDLRGQ